MMRKSTLFFTMCLVGSVSSKIEAYSSKPFKTSQKNYHKESLKKLLITSSAGMLVFVVCMWIFKSTNPEEQPFKKNDDPLTEKSTPKEILLPNQKSHTIHKDSNNEDSKPNKDHKEQTNIYTTIPSKSYQDPFIRSIGSLYGLVPNGLPKDVLDTFYKRLYIGSQGIYSSQTGFLKEGESLQDVVEKDRQTLIEYGVSYEKIYQELSDIIKEAGKKQELYESVTVRQKFEVTILTFRGFQECPFSLVKENYGENFCNSMGACGRGSREIIIKNKHNGKSIKVASLLLHLIRDHHFFEGDVDCRIPPKDIIETLEIEKEENLQLPGPHTLSVAPKLIDIVKGSPYYLKLEEIKIYDKAKF
ncbi:MAG: hypothetical protein AAF335_03765 [Bacteroidota bacterium]